MIVDVRDKQHSALAALRTISRPTSPSKGHLCKPREEQRHKGWWRIQTSDSEESTCYPGFHKGCPRTAPAPKYWCATYQDKPRQEPLCIAFWTEEVATAQEHLMGSRQRVLCNNTRFTKGCLKEESKIGKGRDKGGLGKKHIWLNKGIKR